MDESEKAEQLKKKYIQKYGKEPDMFSFNTMGYDGVILIADQLKKEGNLKDNLMAVRDWEGAGGMVSMNQFGSAGKRQKIFQIQNSLPVLVE